jgi:hypothetical protein
MGRGGDDGHDPAVDVTRKMFPEQADGSRLSRQHDPLRPMAPDQVRDGLGDGVVVTAALLLDAALIMAPASTSEWSAISSPAPSAVSGRIRA